MINSEPHQRKDFSKGVFSEGTVGKMMPFVYVRGFLSHAGKVFEGFNPIVLLSDIVSATETNMDFADVVGNEAAPPPTWLYMKDSKDRYDVSMPLSAYGCFGVLTLNQTPQELLTKVKKVCEDCFDNRLKQLSKNYDIFCSDTQIENKGLLWKTKVVTYGKLCQEAERFGGEKFKYAYKNTLENVLQEMKAGRMNMMQANERLIESVYDYIEDITPRVVIGLLPPYYPNVSNMYFNKIHPQAKDLAEKLMEYTKEVFAQEYSREYFYTGICDLSYINIGDAEAQKETLEASMPLLGEYYHVPFDDIKRISMAGINIGPWGKGLSQVDREGKQGRRVYKNS